MSARPDVAAVKLFEGMSQEDLSCALVGEHVALKAGEHLFREGDPARSFFIILVGTLEAYRVVRGNKVVVSLFHPGMTGGEVPLLSGTPHLANGLARTDLEIYRISAERFWEVMASCPTVRARILSDMVERNKALQTMSFQREKLASLGTLSAGLAHELNNPASAARRTAQALQQTLDAFDRASSAVLAPFLFKEPPAAGVYPFQELQDIREAAAKAPPLDALERSEREDELTDWLEEQGVENAWEAASALVTTGFTREVLARFARRLVPDQVGNFVAWMHRETELHVWTGELAESTRRISELIAALKSWSYMDRALEFSPTDLHVGLDTTLTILGFKLKRKQIEVVKQYATLPPVPVIGAELNQVWTNLIDNAIDALPDKGGRLELHTRLEGPEALVVVRDNGAGIPADVLPKIFDPFFTTKGPGQGTGLGLDICHRIIVDQHQGAIEVTSVPGRTEFIVHLPLQRG